MVFGNKLRDSKAASLLMLLVPFFSFGELNIERTPALLSPPKYFSPAPSGPDMYESFYSTQDLGIEKEYLTRWPVSQLPDSAVGWNPGIYSGLGANNLDPYSSRSQFAGRVLTLRANATIQSYLVQKSTFATVRETGRTLQRLRDLPVTFGEHEQSAELHVGYDVWLDSAKLSVVKGQTEIGMYQSGLLRSRTEVPFSPELRARTLLGNTAVAATLTYRPSQDTVEAALGRPLDTNLYGQISTVQPTTAEKTNVRSVGVRLSYSF